MLIFWYNNHITQACPLLYLYRNSGPFSLFLLFCFPLSGVVHHLCLHASHTCPPFIIHTSHPNILSYIYIHIRHAMHHQEKCFPEERERERERERPAGSPVGCSFIFFLEREREINSDPFVKKRLSLVWRAKISSLPSHLFPFPSLSLSFFFFFFFFFGSIFTSHS
jgi:hypothetical protein